MSNEIKDLFDSDDIARPPFNPFEERAYLEIIHISCDGDNHIEDHNCAARDEFIKRNMKLVLACARRFVSESDPRLPDLVSEGVLGLMRGIDKFNIDKVGTNGKPYRFSTYGMWWIQSLIREALGIGDNRVIRHKSYHEQFKKARDEISAATGLKNIGDEEVYLYLEEVKGWPHAKIVKLRADTDRRIVPVTSIEDPPDGSIEPIDQMLLQERTELLNRELNNMSFEDVYLLMQHYHSGDTYDDIAEAFNLSRERIRQRENAALRQLWSKLSSVIGTNPDQRT